MDYIDIDFYLWLTWLLTPLIITFILPVVLFLLFYMMSIICYVYKYRDRFRGVSELSWQDKARRSVSLFWDAHGWVWHGYEVEGLENLPDTGAIVVYYHGTLPIDMYYFAAKAHLLTGRMFYSVADRFLFKIPGFSIAAEALNIIPGTLQSCCQVVETGHLLTISPGGVYEALFGDQTYPIMWKSRTGFAKVAIASKVPIVPMFTENVREAFRTLKPFRKAWLKVYSWTKLPVVPIYGGFPVKLVTHLGKPIYPKTDSPIELQKQVAEAINEMIVKHQRLPGSIIKAFGDRFYRKPKSE